MCYSCSSPPLSARGRGAPSRAARVPSEDLPSEEKRATLIRAQVTLYRRAGRWGERPAALVCASCASRVAPPLARLRPFLSRPARLLPPAPARHPEAPVVGAEGSWEGTPPEVLPRPIFLPPQSSEQLPARERRRPRLVPGVAVHERIHVSA